MPVKVVYAQETNTPVKICTGAILIIVAVMIGDFIISGRSVFDLVDKFPVILALIFVGWCGRISAGKAITHRKKRRIIIRNGTKCKGKIKDIIQEEHYNASRKDTILSNRLIAEYFSPNRKCMVIITSPVLDATPRYKPSMKCIVYEFNGEAVIDEVFGLEKKKMDVREWGLLFVVVVFFIIAFYFTLRQKGAF